MKKPNLPVARRIVLTLKTVPSRAQSNLRRSLPIPRAIVGVKSLSHFWRHAAVLELRLGGRSLSPARVAAPTAKVLVFLLAVSMAASAAQAAVHYQSLKSFGFPNLRGGHPNAPLIHGSDGALYGATSYLGAPTVFKLNKDGSGYSLLCSLGTNDLDRGYLSATLLEGSNGEIYGTTANQGSHSAGTVFKLRKDGSGYQVLHTFSGGGVDGDEPFAGLVEGRDGALYGTTSYGGKSNVGTVFKLGKDGGGYSILHNFNNSGIDGQRPEAALVEGSDGTLYGTTAYGGTSDGGTVFRLKEDGNGYTVLYHFSSIAGHSLVPGGLVTGNDGVLYGTTLFGGSINAGAVFRLNYDGAGYAILHSFSNNGVDGQSPRALMEASDGSLYGSTSEGGVYTNQYGGGTVFKLNKDGSGYRNLRSFGSTATDGQFLETGVVEGSDGALYGLTAAGGSNNQGTVFKLEKDGNAYSVLRSFLGGSGGDGRNPRGPLAQSSNGTLFGTTGYGGAADSGTVFKLNQDGGGYRVLHSLNFDATDRVIRGRDGMLYGTAEGHDNANGTFFSTVFRLNNDGSGYDTLHTFGCFICFFGQRERPQAGLLEGSDGALYGTSVFDDLNSVFKINTDGTGYTVLHSFTGGTNDGTEPHPDLVEGTDGKLYGSTGGTDGAGPMFKLNKDGSGYSLLPSFADGRLAPSGLVFGSDGALYGTTSYGGSNSAGTVFRLNRDGDAYSTLYSFGASAGDGWFPAGLMEGADGALYGTTSGGGACTNQYGASLGTVFKLNKDGSGYSVLYSFGNTANDGWRPLAGLTQGSDGALYGTTANGGEMNLGTVFKIWPPETPDLIGVTSVDNNVQVSFAGLSGGYYQVLRSTDLASWSVLTNITMPSAGVYTNFDNSPPTPSAYYRAVWTP